MALSWRKLEVIELPEHYGTEILRTEVGSTLHGTGLGVEHEDHDEMGIFVETQRTTIGLDYLEQYTYRSAAEGERSSPGDTDLVVYTLRKWAKLALNGNPSVLLPLYAPKDKLIVETELGHALRTMAPSFASRRAGKAFLGYMEQQRQRLTGERGRAGRLRTRGLCETCSGSGRVTFTGAVGLMNARCSECGGSGRLVDWKYAMHTLRLGLQGVEYLSTGRITLPMPEPNASYLRSVRRGEHPIDAVLHRAEQLEGEVFALLKYDSPLPDQPDKETVEVFVMYAHRSTWEKNER